MARGRTHIVKHRRRRAGKTDYRLRLGVLKSGRPRLVIRKSSKNVTCQIIAYNSKGDKVLASADSRNLGGYGWSGHCGNVPAAYLTGMLCGTKAKKADIKEAVPDIGLYASVKGSRLFAAIKGVVDAGISVPKSDDIMPTQDRIEGKHTSNSDKAAKEFAAAKDKIVAGKAAASPSKKEKTGTKEAKKKKTDITKRPI
jgi:large subunit ribosomal protein L18